MPVIRSSTVRTLLVLAVLGNAAVPGQETSSPRAKMTGWVADLAGKRVPNAEVHLLSWPLPPRTDVGTLDHVQVTTDAQGFFHAELLHGRGYSGHAFWRTGAGTHRTAIAEHLVPGPPRGLEECAPQTLARLRVPGALAWRESGPLQLLVLSGGTNRQRIELKPDGEMSAPLPELPGDTFTVEVRARDGQLLGHARQRPDGDARELVVDLAPPTPVKVVVVDDSGKAIAGATVFQTNHYAYGALGNCMADRLGATAADGALSVQLPAHHPMQDQTQTRQILLVEAEGRARVLALIDLAKTRELRVELPAAPVLCGRILDSKGQPAAGITLLPEAYALAAGVASGGFGVHPRPLVTAADGSFRFDSLHPQSGFRLMAVIDPVRARELGMQIRTNFALAPVLWLAVGAPPFPPRHDLGALRLDQLVFTRIEVRKADQQPAPGALLHVSGGGSYNSPLVYVTDRMGRMQFPLPKGEVKIGAYLKGDGVACAKIRFPAGPDDPKLDPLLLQLTAPVSVRGTVVDESGKPMAGVRVNVFDRPAGDRDLAELAWLSHAPSAPTGSDGAFEVFLPYAGVKQELRVFAPGVKREQNSAMVEVDEDQRQVTGVRIVVSKPE